MSAAVLQCYRPDLSGQTLRPLFGCVVPAGFPSPADDYLDRDLDLNEYFVKHEAATFYVRVSGDSMEKAGIFHNDILIVDRSLEPRDGSIVVAVIDGDMTVKRLQRRDGEVHLMPENDAYLPVKIGPERDLVIWGVVSGIARKFDV